nr:Aminoglycoside/hydroxyurea antibiotic resistance kinase [uncultured organism]
MNDFAVPAGLREGLRQWPSPDAEAWLTQLPATVQELAERWSLQPGEPYDPGGASAWVAPAVDGTGTPCVLKIGRPHTEARDEAAALEAWAGAGAVRLLKSDPAGLLLEECRPGRSLREQPEPEQDVILTQLLKRLWLEPLPGHPFRPLQQMCEEWASSLDPELPESVRAADLLQSLPVSAERHVLLATDLHAGNVLSAEREPWLAIDPKPYLGDPAYDVTQHLLNCPERLRTDATGTAQRVAELAGVEPERVKAWLYARLVHLAPMPGWSWALKVARELDIRPIANQANSESEVSVAEERGKEFDGVPIGRPANGALIDAGYATVADLPEDLDELLKLHGVGPKAVRLLRSERTNSRA